MSTRLGTLTLDLVARIGSFVGPVRDAENQTEVSFGKMRESVSTYGAAAVAGAAAAGTAIFAMAKEFADAANELENYAFISKATTQEFQSYSFGAQTAGIEVETLASQFKDFNEKLGEFITLGSGGGVDFFEQIAIKTEGSAEGARKLALEMQNLSGPAALQLYVDKLEEAGATQQQMSFYLESMASDTTNLIPLLRNGGEGFKFWADAAERYGLIMDESAIQKASEFKVQLGLLDMQVQGAKNQFIQGLMPALVSVGDAMSDATGETNLMAGAGATLGNVFKGVTATGLGVYATVKMLSNAIAGLAVEATDAKKHIDVESGWKKYSGFNLAKGLILGVAASRTSENSGMKMAAKDNAKVAEDIGGQINKIFSDTADSAIAAMAKIQSGQAGVISGSDEWVKKQNEAEKATKANTKAQSDLNRMLEERNRILYEYSSAPDQMQMDLDEEIKRLNKAGMSDYIPIAKARYAEEKKLAEMQFGWDISAHRYTEMQKLSLSFGIKRQEILSDAKLTKDQQKAKLQSLREQFLQEQSILKISQEKTLLEAKRDWMTAGDYAQEYYALVRKEILNTTSYSPEMKDVLIKQANIQQGVDENSEREQVWGDYKSMMGLGDSPYKQDVDLLADARKQMLITEEEYQQQRLGMQVKYGSQYGSDFAGMMMGLVDKSSSAYAILYGVQKAFNLASAIMNGYTAISAAWASAPFPYNLPAVAMATMETGVLQAAISAVSPVGMAHNGIDNIPREGTWLLDGGERVLNPNQNKDLTKYLNDARGKSQSSTPSVNLNPNFVIVDERESLSDYLYSPDGTKALVRFFKRNRSALGV